MSFVALLCAFALGFGVGSIAGIVLGFVWYERKCGLLSDHSGKRAASIRFELDDVSSGPSLKQVATGVIRIPDANSCLPRG